MESSEKRSWPLRLEEQELSLLLEGITDYAIFLIDPDGLILSWNSGAERLKGYRAAEIIGQHMSTFYPPEEALNGGAERLLQEAIQTGRAEEQGWRVRKDGSRFWADVVLSALRRSDGSLRGFAKVTRDLTSRHEREEQTRLEAALVVDRASKLQAVTAALSQSLTQAQVAQVIVSSGVEALDAGTGVVYVLNEAGTALECLAGAGYRTDVLSLWQVIPISLDVPVMRAFHSGEPLWIESHEEYHAIMGRQPVDAMKEGIHTLISLPLRVANRTIGALAFGVFTPRHFDESARAFAVTLAEHCAQAFDRARLYQESQSAVQARGDLLAMVSHDLKNPLSTIQLHASILERKLPDGEAMARLKPRITAIQRAVVQMDSLIHDLLDLSSMEAGHFAIERRPHRLSDLVREAFGMLEAMAAGQNVRIRLESGDLDACLSCDPERIQQVFSNLIGNALRFTPPEGEIRIGVAVLEREVRLELADTGAGIAEDHLPFIFDRFWRTRREGKKGKQGTGLGLSIVQGIVDAHGGKLWVNSRLAEGTTFYFTLPRCDLADDAPSR